MEKFTQNPFAALDKKQFRDGGKASCPQQRGKKKDRARQSLRDAAGQPVAAEDVDDARLFLRAVQQVERKEAKPQGGFPLHEQQTFGQLTGTAQDGALDAEESAAFRAAMSSGKGTEQQRSQGARKGQDARKTRGMRGNAASGLAAQAGGAGKAAASPVDGVGQGRDFASSAQKEGLAAQDDVEALESLVLAEADSDVSAFTAAMKQVAPLAGKGRAVAPAPAAGTPPPGGELGMQDVMDGKLEFALSLTGEYLEGYVVGLDEMTMNKLRAGTFSPEAHLDLHGLNAVQAFQALLGFVRQSWYKGLRTVLVVPGRGLNSPNGYGILRDRLQLWLTQEPFKRVVLAFCTAVPADGGPGSIYVMLRKYRKKGHIYWERMPTDPDLV